MTRHAKRLTRSKRSKQSKRSKRVTRSRGGAQDLDKAFTGVVLPSHVYHPILKPMHGGDGFAYQAVNQPMAPIKGRRGKKRSIKRRGKARALPPGHALPPGFGQIVQSFRPL